jgi:nickel/cobalt exporter
MRRAAGLGVVAASAAAFVVLLAPAASAHPLGNFTVNAYAGLRVAPDSVAVDYVLDLAEIPAYQRHDDYVAAGATASCARLARGLALRLDGRLAALRVEAATLAFPPGQGGVPTLRLECALVASGRGERVTFADATDAGRLGWREVVAAGDGTTLTTSDVPAVSASQRLTRYPADLLRSPLRQRSAALTVRLGGAAAPASSTAALAGHVLPGPVAKATGTLAGLAAHRRVTAPFALVALTVAAGLGALHALAPGHGKTVLAAYLVGQRGSLRHALVIAGTVTATHTAGVLALGVALSASTTLAPEQVSPWLALTSGVLVVLIGAGLLRRAVRDRRHRHSHAHGAHHDHDHGLDGDLSTRRLVTLGFAGGLVPSPSALVVLLGAIALGRAWFGVLLVAAYGAGMALTLTGAGVLLARARDVLARRGTGRAVPRAVLALPVVTAVAVVAAGAVVALRGLGAVV